MERPLSHPIGDLVLVEKSWNRSKEPAFYWLDGRQSVPPDPLPTEDAASVLWIDAARFAAPSIALARFP